MRQIQCLSRVECYNETIVFLENLFCQKIISNSEFGQAAFGFKSALLMGSAGPSLNKTTIKLQNCNITCPCFSPKNRPSQKILINHICYQNYFHKQFSLSYSKPDNGPQYSCISRINGTLSRENFSISHPISTKNFLQ